MIALFLLLAIIAGVLILPGWYWANKGQPQDFWTCCLPAAGLVLWMLLTGLGFGAQSLANLVETPLIAGIAVVVAYLKFFVFDKRSALRSYGKSFAIAAVILATVVLRTFVPVLPE